MPPCVSVGPSSSTATRRPAIAAGSAAVMTLEVQITRARGLSRRAASSTASTPSCAARQGAAGRGGGVERTDQQAPGAARSLALASPARSPRPRPPPQTRRRPATPRPLPRPLRLPPADPRRRVGLVDDDHVGAPEVDVPGVVCLLRARPQRVGDAHPKVRRRERRVVVAAVPDDDVGLGRSGGQHGGIVNSGKDRHAVVYVLLVLLTLLDRGVVLVEVGGWGRGGGGGRGWRGARAC
jgi:hypothetical protein